MHRPHSPKSMIKYLFAIGLVVAGLTGWYPLGTPSNSATATPAATLLAQFSQQGPKLVATDAVGNALQGRSVSISANGNTAIVGGGNDNGGAGAAWVWTRSGGTWTQGSKLVGSGAVVSTFGSGQGIGVAISADGNTAMVGGWNDTGTWVFTRNGNVWTQQGTKLIPSGVPGFGFAGQGSSVALSADGNTALIGGPLNNAFSHGDSGAWVWTRSGGVWTQQGPILVGSGSVGDARQGSSVSISADGNTAIVGGPRDNGGAGAVWVWTRSGGVWTQQGPKLTGSVETVPGRGFTGEQGFSVALSADGNKALVGAPSDYGPVYPSDNAGAARVWARSGGVWTQGAKLRGLGGVSASTVQGFSVSLSADGNTAIVGGVSGNSQTSTALVWTQSGGVWTQQGTRLVGSDAVGSGNSQQPGVSVSLSADDNTAIVGGWNDNSGAGAAWVFTASQSQCKVSDVNIITDEDALMFENAAPNPPSQSLSPPYVTQALFDKVTNLQSDLSSKLGINAPISSGHRPLAYQAHLYELRTKLKAIKEAVRQDAGQEAACQQLKAKLDFEVDKKHGIARDSIDRLPKVNPPALSSHTVKPSTAIDLGGIKNLPDDVQAQIDKLAIANLLVRPAPADKVHFTLISAKSKPSLRVRVGSPVDIMVTDPLGRRIGFDPATSLVVNEIGQGAYYSGPGTEPQLLEIGDTVSGSYFVTGIGTSTGPYTLTMELLSDEGDTISSQVITGNVTAGQKINLLTTNIPNPVDTDSFFVRQNYVDFLNREPDSSGLQFWINEIAQCGSNVQCIEVKRINVSAAFFLSIEFQQTGYLAYRAYKAAFGNMQGKPVPITREEMLSDSQQIGQGIVVNVGDWEQRLEQNKRAFFDQLVTRERFTTLYPQTMTPEQFVDTLNANAGGSLSQAERDTLVSDLNSSAKTRAQVLRAVAEDADLTRAETNKAFVLMQYFGYLRRNPDDAPDSNFGGWQFWLEKLNQFNGNFVQAEMVKAFITSTEYRHRFRQ